MKIAFYTLGCKTNQFETAALQSMFREKGHEIVDFSAFAHVYVVNTCTVTALADKKSRNACRKAKKINPEATLIVCGCYSQINHADVIAQTGADYVLGSANKGQIVELATASTQKKAPQSVAQWGTSYNSMWGQKPDFEVLPPGGIAGRTRALLKVQDGCQNFCTYCLIPFARGPSRSIDIDSAVNGALACQEAGYKEIVITGIEISSWGEDLPGRPTLINLLESVSAAVPDIRLRLGSLEPRTIDENFAKRLLSLKNICPHFHLSLQSGCDKTLKAMNRKYTSARFKESCDILRRYYPNCSITTDLIVGFPGETPEDFECSLAFVRSRALSGMHVFPYSKRRGTAAFAMENQVLKGEKEARAAKAAELKAQLENDYLASLIGKTLPVLFEQEKGELFEGHSPEGVTIYTKGHNLINQIRDVLIEKAENGALFGTITG